MLLNKLVVFLESLHLSISSIPITGLTPTHPTASKAGYLSVPSYNVAAATLPPIAALATMVYLSSRRDTPLSLPPTTLQVADRDPFRPVVNFSPVCSLGSYDGPDDGLRHLTGQCDVPYFIPSPEPTLVKRSTLAWPTCSLAAYDGPDLALRREDGVCNIKNLIFHPKPLPSRDTQHAPTAWAALLSRVPDSLLSGPRQVVSHFSDLLHYLSRPFCILSDTICSDLDWPAMRTLSGKIGLAFHLVTVTFGTLVSHIWSFDKAQAYERLGNLFGREYSLLLTQVLLETARRMSGPVVELGYDFSSFLLGTVEQIPLLSTESIGALRAKVDWVLILPLLRRLGQFFLVLAILSYAGYRQLRLKRRDRKTGLQGADTTVHGMMVENPARFERIPLTSEVDVSLEEAPSPTSPALAELRSAPELGDRLVRGLKDKIPSRMVSGRRCRQVKRKS